MRQSEKDVPYSIEIVIFCFSCSNAWLMISSGISSLKTSRKQTFSSLKQNSSKRLRVRGLTKTPKQNIHLITVLLKVIVLRVFLVHLMCGLIFLQTCFIVKGSFFYKIHLFQLFLFFYINYIKGYETHLPTTSIHYYFYLC